MFSTKKLNVVNWVMLTSSGFSRVTTFNHDFKTRYNLTPTKYRQQ